MPSILATARSALHDAIEAWRDTPPDVEEPGYDPDFDGVPYVVSDFTLLQTHLPRVSLPELRTNGPRVTLIGLGGDEERLSRSFLYQIDQPVQVALQAKVDPGDDDNLETLTLFFEQLRGTARTLELQRYTWLRTDALKDSNRTPFDFVKLREEHTFEAVFTAFYRYAAK